MLFLPVHTDIPLSRIVRRQADGGLDSLFFHKGAYFSHKPFDRSDAPELALGNASPAAELRAVLNVIRTMLTNDPGARGARFVEACDMQGDQLTTLTLTLARNINNPRCTGARLVKMFPALVTQVFDWQTIVIDRRPKRRPPSLRLHSTPAVSTHE